MLENIEITAASLNLAIQNLIFGYTLRIRNIYTTIVYLSFLCYVYLSKCTECYINDKLVI